MTDDSIFREVDEEVRQDEFKKLWDKHGKLFVALASLVLVAAGGYTLFKNYQVKQSEAAGIVYFDAVKKATDGKFDDALAALKAVNHPGYGQLAKLQEADVVAQKGDAAKAVELFKSFAINVTNDPALADLATIKAGYLLIDTAKPDELIASLGKFDKEGQVWRHQAREIFGLTAWRVKDYTMADRYMKALFDDPQTPDGMRQRAQMMIQLIAPYLKNQ